MRIVGLTGYAQSGKDTAAAVLVENGWVKLSFAEPLRAAMLALNPVVAIHREAVRPGWGRLSAVLDDMDYDEAKRRYPEYRELLQRMGTEVGREQFGESFWVDRVRNQIERLRGRRISGVVIPDTRFPNEEAFIHEIGGKVYKVVRTGTEAVNTHVSDTGIDRLRIDGVIPNNGTIEHFQESVLATLTP